MAKRDGEKNENSATREDAAPLGPVAIVVCSRGCTNEWSFVVNWRRSPALPGFLDRSRSSSGSFFRSMSWRVPSSNSTYLYRSVITPWNPGVIDPRAVEVVARAIRDPSGHAVTMLDQRGRSDGSLLPLDDRQERLAVASPRDADGVEDRRSQVHVLDERIGRERAARHRCRVPDDHRDLDGLFPCIVLPGPAVLAVEEPVVGHVDHERVLGAVAERSEQRVDGVVERPRRVCHGHVVLVRGGDLFLGERRPPASTGPSPTSRCSR